jgi:hypothetical protein
MGRFGWLGGNPQNVCKDYLSWSCSAPIWGQMLEQRIFFIEISYERK